MKKFVGLDLNLRLLVLLQVFFAVIFVSFAYGQVECKEAREEHRRIKNQKAAFDWDNRVVHWLPIDQLINNPPMFFDQVIGTEVMVQNIDLNFQDDDGNHYIYIEINVEKQSRVILIEKMPVSKIALGKDKHIILAAQVNNSQKVAKDKTFPYLTYKTSYSCKQDECRDFFPKRYKEQVVEEACKNNGY